MDGWKVRCLLCLAVIIMVVIIVLVGGRLHRWIEGD